MTPKEKQMQKDNEIKTDDELLMQFFDAARQDIPDNGFTRQVMRSLPRRAQRMNRIWTLTCVAIGAAILLLFDGLGELREVAGKVVGDVMGYLTLIGSTGVAPSVVLGSAAVLCLVWLYNVLSIQR